MKLKHPAHHKEAENQRKEEEEKAPKGRKTADNLRQRTISEMAQTWQKCSPKCAHKNDCNRHATSNHCRGHRISVAGAFAWFSVPADHKKDHTAENIAASFQKIAEEWGISRKVVAMVTDNAAVRHTVWTHVSCFAHTLNLVVSEAIKADKKIHQLKLIGEDTRNCFPIAIQCYTNWKKKSTWNTIYKHYLEKFFDNETFGEEAVTAWKDWIKLGRHLCCYY